MEQRLAQLEARLNLAEQQASEASRPGSGEQKLPPPSSAAAAEQQVQALSQQTTAREQKQQAT
ncbi:carbohydrate porin [Klebsiella pneumoniae]|nr:carbohydrate porin [Klebsiella pneumoniae]